MAEADRIKRLRTSVLAMPTDALRSAASNIGEDTIRALPGPARPLANQLRRSSDPAALLRRLPNVTVLAMLADFLSDECLDRTREVLGDDADDPTREQLHAAVDTVVEEFDVPTVRVMLATVAVAEAEASALCDELLVDDERFALDDDPTPTGGEARPARQGPSEEVLARRRERKEAEKARKAAQRQRASQPKAKKKGGAPAPAPAEEPPAPIAATGRRAPTGVPAGFDAEDPLVGSVVVADVPFDDGVGGKTRPAVVVAVGDDEVVVRPCYSEGGMQSRRWQAHQVRDLAAVGFTKPSWIEPDARTIPRADIGEVVGRLSDHDWNALF